MTVGLARDGHAVDASGIAYGVVLAGWRDDGVWNPYLLVELLAGAIGLVTPMTAAVVHGGRFMRAVGELMSVTTPYVRV